MISVIILCYIRTLIATPIKLYFPGYANTNVLHAVSLQVVDDPGFPHFHFLRQTTINAYHLLLILSSEKKIKV